MDAREPAEGSPAVPDDARGVGVGFIGAGNVLPAYQQLLDRLIPRGLAWEGPVMARDPARWDELRRRRPGIELVSTADDVWNSDVGIVVVITPPATHAEVVASALAHGKHVVCEKPLAMSRAEAEPLVRLAGETGRHVVAAPFVHLSPTFRELWTRLRRGELGTVHSARGLYGNAGVTWSGWYHEGGVGPPAELGLYNLKSLACLLGPVREVVAAESTAVAVREVGGRRIDHPDPDVTHLVLRHAEGAISSVVASHAIAAYRRPGLELYGTEGTANLLGDDWDPRGLEIYRRANGAWTSADASDPTWLWTDGLRELIVAVGAGRAPLASPTLDLHLLEVVDAARVAARSGRVARISSSFDELDLAIDPDACHRAVHDHTRPAEDQ